MISVKQILESCDLQKIW